MATYNRRGYYQRRRRRKRTEVFTSRMRFTLLCLFFLFLIVFVVLAGRIYSMDKNDGDRYRKAALSQQAYTNTTLNYRRGTIKDRNNTTLAVSIRKYNLVLEPRTLMANETNKDFTLKKISKHFGVELSVLEQVVEEHPDSMYEHIDGLKELSSDMVDKFKEKMDKIKEEEAKKKKEKSEEEEETEEDQSQSKEIIGVWFEEVFTRNYPLGNVGCHLVGFMSAENAGAYGVEKSYNDYLCGTTGREYGYFDTNMNLQRTIKPAKDGDTVVMTIDANVQQLVEKQIADFQSNGVGAERVAVMLMNPKNGEILAMASDISYDLNNPNDLSGMYTSEQINKMSNEEVNSNCLAMWSNFCLSSAYEPGSTFKPFTIAAGLDENVINDNSTFTCNGVLKVADREIHCSNRSGHGVLDLRHSLMESCNAALMSIGMKLGADKFYEYTKLYGFGQRTGIDLPDETSGQIHPKDQLNITELATSSFGQTQTVTMVQMMSGFCSLINGGNYYQPHVVKEIQNSNGDVIESFEPVVVKTTTTAATSKKLRSYLLSTVEEGTAKPAAVKGYAIGGKTGTAEKNGRDKRNYLVSFIGCTPAEDPEVAIYVVVDEPHAKDQAHSTYATEFASKIMKKVLPFLNQFADKSQSEDTSEKKES